MVYTVYLYLELAAELSADPAAHVGDGVRHLYRAAVPDRLAVVNIIANWIGDKALSTRGGACRKAPLSGGDLRLLLTASGIIIPYVESVTAMIILVTFAVSFANCGPATNGALTNDLLRSPADAGRALAFLVLGGNTFGLCAPIVTGYLVAATGSFNTAFIAAGVIALVGAVAALTLSRGTLGEAPAPQLARQPGLVG